MKFGQFAAGAVLGWLAPHVVGRATGVKPSDFIIAERSPLQSIVTWDEHSLFVHGERIIFWGGEVHPFRFVHLPTIRSTCSPLADFLCPGYG